MGFIDSKPGILRLMTALLAVVLLFAGFSAPAAENNLSSNTTSSKKKNPKKAKAPEAEKSWSVIGVVNRTRNLYDHEDGSLSESNDFYFILNNRLSENWRSSVLAVYSQSLRTPENSDWADTQITLSRAAQEISTNFSMGYSGTALLPTSKNSQGIQNMKGAAGGSVSFSFNKGVLMPGLNLGASLSLVRIFHAYETATNGRVLSPWSFKQIFSAGYSFGNFSIGGSFIHRNSYSYQNNMKESFEHTQELGYSISQNFSVAVGHYLAGGALKPNGYESNLSLTDEENSLAYVSLAVSY